MVFCKPLSLISIYVRDKVLNKKKYASNPEIFDNSDSERDDKEYDQVFIIHETDSFFFLFHYLSKIVTISKIITVITWFLSVCSMRIA